MDLGSTSETTRSWTQNPRIFMVQWFSSSSDGPQTHQAPGVCFGQPEYSKPSSLVQQPQEVSGFRGGFRI